MSELPPGIFKLWIHSHEEDTAEAKVYRPSHYPLPPARGREGFEIKENGEFVQYGIGPDDRPQIVAGRWKAEGANRIGVSLKDRGRKSYTLDIVSCDENILRIKR